MNNQSAKLPVRTKLAYGLGSIAFGIKDHGFNTLLMLYYNQVVGLPAAWVGSAIMIATLVDAFADPLIGHFSDHLTSRWGRRHPFMYGAAIPLALAYALFWSPPQASHEIQFVYLLLTSIAVRVAISCYEIPSSALTAEFTSDYNERTSLATYRTLFQAIGLVVMGVLVFKVFLRPTAEQPVGQLNASGYVTYGFVAAAVMLVGVLVSTWGTHDRIALLKPMRDSDRVGLKGLLGGLKLLFSDRTYASLVACIFFFAVATGLSTTLGVYISTYFWRLNADQLGAIAGAAGLGVVLGLVVVLLSRKIGKKPMCIGLYSVALIAATTPVTLGLMGLMPRDPGKLMPWLLAQNAILLMSVIAAVIMGASMIADAADHIELKTGRRMEGLMFAALIMVNKAVSGMGVFLSGIILSFIHFPGKADPATVDPGIVHQLGVIHVVLLGGFVLLAMLCITFYPITREMHERTLAALRRQAETATAV